MRRLRVLMTLLAVILCLGGCKREPAPPAETLEMHVIAVGEAQSVLLKQGSHAMLIDAADAAHAMPLVAYLHENGVEKLDCVLQTFPSLQHMGGAEKVIRHYDTARYLYTSLPERFGMQTVHHERLQTALEEEGVATADVSGGMTYMLGEATVEIYPINGFYHTAEGYATVCRVTYGEKRFLLFSQTDDEGVNALLNSGVDLTADVVKLPQSGAKTASTRRLLGAVSPQAAVTAGGDGKTCPHRDTVALLQDHGITLWRTDRQGTIVFTTDGKNTDLVTVSR